MKYLKYFETEAEYTQFKDSEDYILPNVSYIEDIDTVEYGSNMQKILNVNEFYIEEYENILDIFNRMNIDTIDLKNAERDFPELYEYFKNISINYENTHASIDLIYYYSNDRIYFICDDIPPVGWYICSKEEYPEYYGFFHCLIG